MASGIKRDILRNLSFGDQVAEEEREALKQYFVRTHAWERIYNGDIDIIYGPKGSGKSALYVLIQEHTDELFDRRVLLVSAESPRGAPAFKDLETDPPTSEREFTSIWKLYFLSLLARAFRDFGINNASSAEIERLLEEQGLLPEQNTTFGSILRSVRNYVSRMMRPSSVEGGVTVDPATGAPTFAGKILFEEPDIETQRRGFTSIDEMLSKASVALDNAAYDAWIMIDRLDVAFDESSELERNALRALFRTYRDLRGLIRLKLKIFIRTDIWKRITEDGFREATHLSRDTHIAWDKPSIQNLIVRRLINNQAVVQAYSVNKEEVISSAEMQERLFARVFPTQVEIGKKQSTTIDWLLRRTSDGTNKSQP
jgi:hypothetical protein